MAYSRRFHGAGSWPEQGDYSADAHEADLVALIRRLDSGPVHLVGFSTAIALRVSLRAPALVRSLAIIEPNVPWLLEGDPEEEAVLAWWREANERVETRAAGNPERRAKLWFELVNNRGRGAFEAQPEPLRRMWLENFNRKRPAVSSSKPLTCEQLGAIATPTLAMSAEYGLAYSRAIIEKLLLCIPDSHLVVIPSVTHFMSYQEPATFNEIVLDFVRKH